jgi:hypothetical protein
MADSTLRMESQAGTGLDRFDRIPHDRSLAPDVSTGPKRTEFLMNPGEKYGKICQPLICVKILHS